MNADTADSRADLRNGGAWTRRQRLKNDALYVLAMVALAVSRALPLAALGAIGRGLGRAAHAFARGARQTATANVARVYPAMPEAERRALVLRSFITMGELLADAVSLLRRQGGPLLELTPAARAVLGDAQREGRGVLFASAHLGPWERVAASLAAAGFPFATLARESYDPRFSRLYARLRGSRGVRVVWRSSASVSAGSIGILRTLRGGVVLGVPMDLRSRVACCEAPFLGHLAPTPVGPARIALRTGAAVVVGTVAPSATGDGTLVITATRIDTRTGTPGVDPAGPEAERDLTARINDELSARIRALPHAWVWMHERWSVAAPVGDTLLDNRG